MKIRLKKIISIVILTALLLSACSRPEPEKTFAKTGKVGVIVGGILDVFCEDVVPGSVPDYYYAAADMPLALETGKIDAYIDDELSAIDHCKVYDTIRIDKVVYSDHYGFIFNKDSRELCSQMNEYILTLRENGGLDELRRIWIDGEDESLQKVDYENLSGENGTLNIAIAATMPPMIYVKDGQYAGYEVAVLAGFCRQYGYGVEFSNSDFSSVMAAVTSGVSDIGAASISITEERKKSMLFSESHVEANAVSVVRKEEKTEKLSLEDFSSARIGMLDGSIHISTAQKHLPDATLQYFSSNFDMASSLKEGKIDGYIVDEPVARSLSNYYENQKILTILDPFSFVYALPKGDPDSEKLQEQLDNYLYEIKENGTLQEIDGIWFGKDESLKTIDLNRLKKNSKMLTLAAFAVSNEPFIYTKEDGNYLGYEIDILARFCDKYGYDLDINEYTFDDLMLALENGKCDIAAGAIAATEEREESFLLSVPHYEAGNVLVVKSFGTEVKESSFFTKITDSFHKTFLQESRWKLFLQGITTTVLISVASITCGSLLAFLLYLIYYQKNAVLNKIINGFCEIVEKTPAVVILMIFYYIVFGSLDIHAAVVAAFGLSLKFSVRVFGLLYIGVGSISKGQTEAAYALGYTPGKTFMKIIFPQAVMRILSGYKSNVVNLIEETAVVGYIAVQDLTKISDIIRSRTYEPFFPLLASAAIYIGIAVLLIFLVNKIEIRIDPKRRSEEDILGGIKR